jgi:phosphatidylserine/phosphatidylglycerophosphate/cardiolipin synthase-like enzyme
MRARHRLLSALVAVLLSGSALAAPADAATEHPDADRGRAAGQRWAPPVGLLLNDPLGPRRRVILDHVQRSIAATPRGEKIQIVVWNLDNQPMVRALLRAHRRGVAVQVVVSSNVDNPSWTRLRTRLTRNTRDDSFARKCWGTCRGGGGIMHTKFFLFSRVRGAHKVSMFGSVNLTTAAADRQWNDLVTLHDPEVYDHFAAKFVEYARDRPVAEPYDVFENGSTSVTLFPAVGRNPVAAEFRKVSCRGATGGTGTPGGRTRVRIAIAGWFDAFGDRVARQVRGLWDRGCDVRIVTTLTGRGVNRVLRAPRGRGPVPIREITIDRNEDLVPERYLHMKSVAISGVYAGDTASSVVITGSPNWSARAQRSDEVLVRMTGRPGMVQQYQRHVDRLFHAGFAHWGPASQGRLWQAERTEGGAAPVPAWFDND